MVQGIAQLFKDIIDVAAVHVGRKILQLEILYRRLHEHQLFSIVIEQERLAEHIDAKVEELLLRLAAYTRYGFAPGNEVLYGGGTTEFHTLVGIDKYADLASHPVTKALGEDGLTKLMAKSGGFASSIERNVIRLDPELSFEVKPSSSK